MNPYKTPENPSFWGSTWKTFKDSPRLTGEPMKTLFSLKNVLIGHYLLPKYLEPVKYLALSFLVLCMLEKKGSLRGFKGLLDN